MTLSDPTLLTGPLLLGHLFNTFLYGIELVQFYRYHICFPDERPWTRRLVYAVVILDTMQTAFTIHNAWQILGSGWGNPDEILHPEWSWGSVPLFTGLVSLLVQGFYALRISKLIQSKLAKLIVALVVVIAVTQAACGIFSGAYYAFGSLTGSNHMISAVTTLWLGGSALCDLVISATTVTFLLVQLSGFTPTDNVVQKVIKMTVETGAITTSAAAADLVLFLLFPNNNLHLIFCIPLAKLYSNTLLAMLNARKGSFMPDTNPAEGTLPIMIHMSKNSNSFINSAHYHHESTTSLPRSSNATVYDQVPASSPPLPQRHALPASPLRPYQMVRPAVPKQSAQRGLSKSHITSHKRTESTQRFVDPGSSPRSAIFTPQSRGWRKHNTKSSDLPSHLDMTIDANFRTRFLNKFQNII